MKTSWRFRFSNQYPFGFGCPRSQIIPRRSATPPLRQACFPLTPSSFISTVLARLLARHSPMTTEVEPPSSFLCPITKDLMCDPVTCTDGHSYDRTSILAWLSRQPHDDNPSPDPSPGASAAASTSRAPAAGVGFRQRPSPRRRPNPRRRWARGRCDLRRCHAVRLDGGLSPPPRASWLNQLRNEHTDFERSCLRLAAPTCVRPLAWSKMRQTQTARDIADTPPHRGEVKPKRQGEKQKTWRPHA
jgi:hypothetical protein